MATSFATHYIDNLRLKKREAHAINRVMTGDQEMLEDKSLS